MDKPAHCERERRGMDKPPISLKTTLPTSKRSKSAYPLASLDEGEIEKEK